MKILSSDQIRDLDSYTIKFESISSIDLMERASSEITNWIIINIKHNCEIFIFCGPGNNGGDGLAVARMLLLAKFKVTVFVLDSIKYSQDFTLNLNKLKNIENVNYIRSENDFPLIHSDKLIIDSLFGSGLNKELSGLNAKLVRHLNQSQAAKVSIDIASGLMADSNSSGIIFQPDITLTFQLPKLAFFLPQNERYVGKLVVLPIGLSPEFILNAKSDFYEIDENFIIGILKKRSKFSHKGTFGHALVIAGKYGSIGAAVLTTKACFRTGAGLVTAYIPKCGFDILQSSIPEAMVVTDIDFEKITSIPALDKYSAIGIGPGLSEAPVTVEVLKQLFISAKIPLVIDASALNVISSNLDLLKLIPEKSVLTPHPKEFERLTGPFENDFDRMEKQKQFARKLKSIVIVKGAHTSIAFPDGKVFFNSTGNPGMATGGSGDVLTGVITALLAQGYSSEEASIVGVYLHGFAGDSASKRTGMAPLLATDIIEGIKDFFLCFERIRIRHSEVFLEKE